MKPDETTATILAKLQNAPFENVVIHIGNQQFIVPTSALKLLAWNAIPDMIKDEQSQAARDNLTLRTGLKAILRPMLPKMLAKTWGKEIEIEPRLNVLNWLPNYLIHLLINMVASKEWAIHVEPCAGCQENTFKITGISPHTNTGQNASALPAAPTDHQPVPGREEPDPSGTADHHLSGRPVGHRGDDR